MRTAAPASTPTEADPLGARIVAVIPTLNEASGIEDCLRSLMGRGTEAVRFVVSDGGSADGTRAIVRTLASEHRNLSLVRNDRRTQAAAVNDVARGAPFDRDLIVRCDAHATYPPGYVLGVTRSLLARDAVSLVVAMDTAARPGAGAFERANALAIATRLGTGGSAHRGGQRSGPVDHGHHAGLRRSAFLEVGGYDEALPANEDAELDTRLARAGGVIWLDAGLRPVYHPRRTPGALWRQYARYGAGRARHARRHAVRLRARQVLPALLAPTLGAGLALGVFFPPALLVPGSYLAVLTAASVLIAARARDAAGLLSGAALGIMHLGWSVGFWRGVLGRDA